MISVSKLCKVGVLFSALLLLGYIRLIDSFPIHNYAQTIRFTIALLGVLLAILVIPILYKNKLFGFIKNLNLYILIYSIVIIISSLLTWYQYDYSLKELLLSLTPYLYAFYAYPILYIFIVDKNYDAFIAKICFLCFTITLIKAVSWILYTQYKFVLFPNLLFEYGTWSRNGVLRCNYGYIFPLTFVYYFDKLINQKKLFHIITVSSLLLFAVFITNYRYLIITLVIVAIIMLYYSKNVRINKKYKVSIVYIGLIILLTSGVFRRIISSFAVDSEYGRSTSARIETVYHYWDLMIKNNGVFGLGFLNINNSTAYDLMKKTTLYGNTLYYLEDIGIIGGFYVFGILSLLVFGGLYYYGIKTSKISIKRSTYGSGFLLGIVAYMIISCFALNIFDLQRAFDIPFYLAIIAYSNYINLSAKNKTKNLFEGTYNES